MKARTSAVFEITAKLASLATAALDVVIGEVMNDVAIRAEGKS